MDAYLVRRSHVHSCSSLISSVVRLSFRSSFMDMVLKPMHWSQRLFSCLPGSNFSERMATFSQMSLICIALQSSKLLSLSRSLSPHLPLGISSMRKSTFLMRRETFLRSITSLIIATIYLFLATLHSGIVGQRRTCTSEP